MWAAGTGMGGGRTVDRESAVRRRTPSARSTVPRPRRSASPSWRRAPPPSRNAPPSSPPRGRCGPRCPGSPRGSTTSSAGPSRRYAPGSDTRRFRSRGSTGRRFDVVATDAGYRDARNADQLVDGLRALTALGRPAAVTEFGYTTYRGSVDAGGRGAVIEWDDRARPTRFTTPVTRDEQAQADYCVNSSASPPSSPSTRSSSTPSPATTSRTRKPTTTTTSTRRPSA